MNILYNISFLSFHKCEFEVKKLKHQHHDHSGRRFMKVKRSPTWKGEGSVPQIVQLWIPFRPHKNTHIHIRGCELVLSPSLLPQNELGSRGFPSHKTSCKRMHDDFMSEVGFTSQWFCAQLFAFQLCLCSSHLLSSLPQHLFF